MELEKRLESIEKRLSDLEERVFPVRRMGQ